MDVHPLKYIAAPSFFLTLQRIYVVSFPTMGERPSERSNKRRRCARPRAQGSIRVRMGKQYQIWELLEVTVHNSCLARMIFKKCLDMVKSCVLRLVLFKLFLRFIREIICVQVFFVGPS